MPSHKKRNAAVVKWLASSIHSEQSSSSTAAIHSTAAPQPVAELCDVQSRHQMTQLAVTALVEEIDGIRHGVAAAQTALVRQQARVTAATLAMLQQQTKTALATNATAGGGRTQSKPGAATGSAADSVSKLLCPPAERRLVMLAHRLRERLRDILERFHGALRAFTHHQGLEPEDDGGSAPRADASAADAPPSVAGRGRTGLQSKSALQTLAAAATAGDVEEIHRIIGPCRRREVVRLLTTPYVTVPARSASVDNDTVSAASSDAATTIVNDNALLSGGSQRPSAASRPGDRAVHAAAREGHADCVQALCAAAERHDCVSAMLASLSASMETPLYVLSFVRPLWALLLLLVCLCVCTWPTGCSAASR